MRICTKCGRMHRDEDQFCPICGAQNAQHQQQTSEEPQIPSGQGAPVSPPEMEAQPSASGPEDTETQPPEAAEEPAAESSFSLGSGNTVASEAKPEDAKPVFCSKCGTKNPSGSVFCAACGTKIPPALPQEDLIPVSEPYYSQADEFYQQDEPTKKGSKKLLVGVVIAACLVLVCVGAFLIYQVIPRSSGLSPSEEQPIIYVQNDNVLKYKNSDMERAETITSAFDISTDSEWEVNYLTATSHNARYVLYLNDYRRRDYSERGRGDLYIRDISVSTEDGQPNDRGIKIASDVTTDFYFSDDDQYVFYIDFNGDLYSWDFNESYRIDSDVKGIYTWNDEKVLYYKGDEVSSYTSYFTEHDVYLAPLAHNSRDSRLKIDTDISDLLDWTEDFSQFLFTKSTSSSDDEVLFDLYLYETETDTREKLLSDIGEVMDADVETQTAVYLVPRQASITVEDILDDDMARSDENIKEPDLEDYPLLSKLYDDILDLFGWGWLYGYGYGYYDDYDFLEEFLELYGSDYVDDLDALEAEIEAFDEATEEYEAKQLRDEFRTKIQDEIDYQAMWYNLSLYDLHLYSAGERTKIDSNVVQSGYSVGMTVLADPEDGYVVYMRRDFSNLERTKMSELTETGRTFTFDVSSYLEEHLLGEVYISFFDGSSTLLSEETERYLLDATDVYMLDDLSGMYFLQEDKNNTQYYEYQLYYAPIEGKTVGSPELVDENVAYFMWFSEFGGKQLYLKNRKGDKCDLYSVDGTTKERLCYDISYSAYSGTLDDEGPLFFYENYDTSRNTGDLYMLTDEKIKISDDAYDFYYRDKDLIYIYKDYRAGKGDLYVFDGDTLTLVDYDVTTVMGY